MDTKTKVSERAVAHFREGYNCAQSVLMTMFEHWNLKSALVPKIATGFGGGIGRCGSVCGAVTGGVMAISVKYGTNSSLLEERLKAYDAAQMFYRQFETRNGSVICKELIGFDLSVPEQYEEAVRTKVTDEKCTVYVKTAVEILLKLTQTLNNSKDRSKSTRSRET